MNVAVNVVCSVSIQCMRGYWIYPFSLLRGDVMCGALGVKMTNVVYKNITDGVKAKVSCIFNVCLFLGGG